MRMGSELDQLLGKYASLKCNEEKTKIICEWSGHEMPLSAEHVNSYVSGNKYKKLLTKNINQADLAKYKEFLVASTKSWGKNQFFCLLTLKHVNKQPDHVQKHVEGRRFQKSYQYWLECQEKGVKFVPLCKQRYVPEEQEGEDQRGSGGESETEEMFDMMAMEEDIDEIEKEDRQEDHQEGHQEGHEKDENNNGQAEERQKANGKAKRKQKTRADESSVLAEQERLADESGEPVERQKSAAKRSLDAKLNKKLKIEPRKKKQAVDAD